MTRFDVLHEISEAFLAEAKEMDRLAEESSDPKEQDRWTERSVGAYRAFRRAHAKIFGDAA